MFAGGRHVDRSALRAADPCHSDRPAAGANAAIISEQDHIAGAVADLGDRHACRDRVLAAIEDVLKFDTDLTMRRAARNRYLELTEVAA